MFLRNIKNKFLYNFLFALRMDECSRVPYAIRYTPYTVYKFTISDAFSYTKMGMLEVVWALCKLIPLNETK